MAKIPNRAQHRLAEGRISRRSRPQRQGQTMVEFIVILPLVMFAIFACIQYALLYQAKTTLNYAVFQAARYAAINRGRLEAVQDGFAVGLSPLFTRGISGRDLLNARQRVDQQIADCWVRFDRISPPESAFADFGYTSADEPNTRSIPNDNLLFRNAEPGPLSQLSIQDANLLKLQATYCVELFMPLVGRFLADEADFATGRMQRPADMPDFSTSNDARQAMDCRTLTGSNSIPIVASAIVRMQSDLLDEDFVCQAPP